MKKDTWKDIKFPDEALEIHKACETCAAYADWAAARNLLTMRAKMQEFLSCKCG